MAKKETKIVHSFVINEDQWIHGTKEKWVSNSGLRLDDGKMCCLGFYAQSCGVKAMDLLGLGEPCELSSTLIRSNKKLELLFDEPLALIQKPEVDELIEVNDQDGLTLAQRKSKVKKLFRELGVKVEFTSKKAKASKKVF